MQLPWVNLASSRMARSPRGKREFEEAQGTDVHVAAYIAGTHSIATASFGSFDSASCSCDLRDDLAVVLPGLTDAGAKFCTCNK
jgi:hypothetical protein